jgi:hypothetical protein
VIKWLRCFFGMHRWQLTLYNSRYGVAFGNKCADCGLWAKDAIRGPKEPGDAV